MTSSIYDSWHDLNIDFVTFDCDTLYPNLMARDPRQRGANTGAHEEVPLRAQHPEPGERHLPNGDGFCQGLCAGNE